MKQLVIATHNRDKFREMSEALSGIGWEILPAFGFPGVPEVVEDGTTLEENSAKKASEISRFTGLAALSDDTGLFVDALQGAPGIYAARYAGEGCSYADNVQKLLGALQGVPRDQRRAVFRTVVTIHYPNGSRDQVSGEVEGTILGAVRGSQGFGYDPVFQPKGLSKVFAEMSVEEKNRISHRGLAVAKARTLLSQR